MWTKRRIEELDDQLKRLKFSEARRKKIILELEAKKAIKKRELRPFSSTDPTKIYKYNVAFYKKTRDLGALPGLVDMLCVKCNAKPDVWFKSRLIIARNPWDFHAMCQKCATEKQCHEEEAIGETKKPPQPSISIVSDQK